MATSKEFFPDFRLRQRVLKLMESEEKFGGPQSVDDLCKSLRITNGSSRSILVNLNSAGDIERIGKGKYRLKGDGRSFNPHKSHLQ